MKKTFEDNLRLAQIMNQPDWEHLFLFWEIPVPQKSLLLNRGAFPPKLAEIYEVVNAYYVLLQNNIFISPQMVQDFVAVKNRIDEELHQYLKMAASSSQEDIMVVGMLENFRIFCESVINNNL